MHATVLSSPYAIVVSNIMEAGTKVKKNLIEYLLKEKAKHKGKWLTWDAVNEYRRRVQIAAYYGRFCGAKRPQCEAERPGFLLI